MSTTQAPAPRLTNVGIKPAVPRKLFVNIPVNDLQRSIDFFEALGFTFNAQFTDATATAMLVGEDAYFMLLDEGEVHELHQASARRRHQGDERAYALGVESRAAVDAMVKQAVAAGGSHALDPQDHGFMYGWSFYDLDGHHWEVFWMDPSAVVG